MVKHFFYKLRTKRMIVLQVWNSTDIILDFSASTHEVNVSLFKYKYICLAGMDLIFFIATCMIV